MFKGTVSYQIIMFIVCLSSLFLSSFFFLVHKWSARCTAICPNCLLILINSTEWATIRKHFYSVFIFRLHSRGFSYPRASDICLNLTKQAAICLWLLPAYKITIGVARVITWKKKKLNYPYRPIEMLLFRNSVTKRQKIIRVTNEGKIV